MKITRREFIKGAAGTAGAAGLLMLQPPARALAREQTHAGLAMVVDVTKCVSCWWCYAACKEYNQLGETTQPDVNEPPPLSATVWTTLHPVKKDGGWVSRKQACNHCTQAACVEVCPTGALSYNSLGFVQYDQAKCTGCGYCAEFCPFGIPQMDDTAVTGVAIMNKCTFCQDRVAEGLPTACAAACPTGAIQFGQRSDLITAAENRVEELQPTVPQASVYGVDELHGLHVMYVLDDAPEVYGLPTDPQVPDAVTVRDIFKWVGTGLVAAAVAGFGLNYLVSRIRMARGEK